jgi:hypothetical protein
MSLPVGMSIVTIPAEARYRRPERFKARCGCDWSGYLHESLQKAEEGGRPPRPTQRLVPRAPQPDARRGGPHHCRMTNHLDIRVMYLYLHRTSLSHTT